MKSVRPPTPFHYRMQQLRRALRDMSHEELMALNRRLDDSLARIDAILDPAPAKWEPTDLDDISF